MQAALCGNVHGLRRVRDGGRNDVLERLFTVDAFRLFDRFLRFFTLLFGGFFRRFVCVGFRVVRRFAFVLLFFFRRFLFFLFLVGGVLLQVKRLDVRLVLRVRHRPERQHLVNRRDEERIWRHVLEPHGDGADELAVDVDGAAAHALQNAARLLDDGAGGLRHDHRRRAFAVVDRADDVDGEITNLAGVVDDGVRRARHAGRNLARVPDLIHGRHGQ